MIKGFIRFYNVGFKVVCIFTSVYFLLSCREIVQDDFPAFEQKPVMNALLMPDSLLEVHCSFTNKIDTMPLAVFEQANISLFINDTFYQQLIYTQNGVYLSNHIIEPLNTYYCEWLFDDSGLASSEDIVPDKTPVEWVNALSAGWVDTDGSAQPLIEFTITNNPDTIKYYEAWVLQFTRSTYGQLGSFNYDQKGLISLFSSEFESDTIIIKSIEFNNFTGANYIEYAYMLELRSVSAEYYKYRKSIELYEEGRYPNFDVAIPEPSNLYTNVENGYGVFVAYNSYFTDTLFTN